MRKEANVCLTPQLSEVLFSAIDSFDSPSEVLAQSHLLLKHSYVRKYNSGKRSSEREARTKEAWLKAEEQCFRTNQKLARLTDFDGPAQFLLRCRALIENIIGVSPPRGLLWNGRWSGGATFSTRRGTHHSVKMEELTVTHPVSFMLAAFAGISDSLTIVKGCRACAVPKNDRVDRMIAIEPSGNAFLQQSVGGFIRKRLLSRANIDLNDQSRNQDGAFRAIVDDLSTIDLEAASDTISVELVRWLLPADWFALLNALRSPSVLFDGKWRYLDKFSSMGNGFTFELETLIFWCICKACGCNRELLTYGDDLIVPRENSADVILALSYCGFSINTEKTFIDGRYFESCGKHYFDLEEVTPCFQKEPIINLLSALRAHNRLVRWSVRTGDWKTTRRALKLIREAYPSRCAIPFGCERDDGYLIHPSLLKQDSNGDFICRVVVQRTLWDDKVNERNALAYKLYNSCASNELPTGHSGRARKVIVVGERKTLVWGSSLT